MIPGDRVLVRCCQEGCTGVLISTGSFYCRVAFDPGTRTPGTWYVDAGHVELLTEETP